MIRNAQWQAGFVAGTLLLIWSAVFLFILSYHLSLGPGLLLAYLTTSIFLLLTLLMLILVFFRRTRPFSFGLALPLLVLHTGLFTLTLIGRLVDWTVGVPLIHVPGGIALLVVAIIYFTRGRHGDGRVSAAG